MTNKKCQCCSVVGSGDLISRIWRIETNSEIPEYRFTIAPTQDVNFETENMFRTADLWSMINLLRVIAQELVQDGGFSASDKTSLKQLAELLETVTAACEKARQK